MTSGYEDSTTTVSLEGRMSRFCWEILQVNIYVLERPLSMSFSALLEDNNSTDVKGT